MEWISFKNMVSWFTEEFREVFDDFAIMFGTGLVAFLGSVLLGAPLQLGSAVGGVGAALAMLLAYTLGDGAIEAILYSVAKARLHGRRPMVRDFLPSPWVVLHLAVLKGVTILVVGGLFLLISGPSVFATIQAGRMGGDIASAARGLIPSLIVLMLFLWIFSLLTMFSPAMVVDRRVHFGHALMYSADCVWRDPLGLALFMFLWIILKATLAVFAVCGNLCLILGFVIQAIATPLLIGIRLRAYRDYFGLATDWVYNEDLTARGHSDFVREIQQDAQLRGERYGAQQPPQH